MSIPADFTITVLSSAGVSVTLITFAVWLLRTWIVNRLSAGIRHEYDQRLTELSARLKQQGDAATTQLKAEMDRLSERLRHSAQSLGEVQKATIERRLAGIEEVWLAVLTLQETLPSVFATLDVLFDEEYQGAMRNAKIGPQLKAINHLAILGPALEKTDTVSKRRPFIGNYLWVLFSTYRAILFRMVYLVSQSQKEPEKIHWYSDKLIRMHIQAALGDQLLTEFDCLKTLRVSWIRDHFSRAVLDSMESVIEGLDFSEAAMRQAEKMEALLFDPKGRH